MGFNGLALAFRAGLSWSRAAVVSRAICIRPREGPRGLLPYSCSSSCSKALYFLRVHKESWFHGLECCRSLARAHNAEEAHPLCVYRARVDHLGRCVWRHVHPERQAGRTSDSGQAPGLVVSRCSSLGTALRPLPLQASPASLHSRWMRRGPPTPLWLPRLSTAASPQRQFPPQVGLRMRTPSI